MRLSPETSNASTHHYLLQVKAQSKNMMRLQNGLEKMDFHPLVNILLIVLN